MKIKTSSNLGYADMMFLKFLVKNILNHHKWTKVSFPTYHRRKIRRKIIMIKNISWLVFSTATPEQTMNVGSEGLQHLQVIFSLIKKHKQTTLFKYLSLWMVSSSFSPVMGRFCLFLRTASNTLDTLRWDNKINIWDFILKSKYERQVDLLGMSIYDFTHPTDRQKIQSFITW